MKIEALLLGMALIFPGAAAAKAWSYVMHHEDWDRLTLVSVGAFLSLALYSVPQLAGWIDLVRLFGPTGKIQPEVLFESGSILTFFGLTIAGVVGAISLGRLALSKHGELIANLAFGKSLVGAAWGPIAQDVSGEVVYIHLDSGTKIYGPVERISTLPEGHIVIAGPRFIDPKTGDWTEPFESRLVLRLSAIDYLEAPITLARETRRKNADGKLKRISKRASKE